MSEPSEALGLNVREAFSIEKKGSAVDWLRLNSPPTHNYITMESVLEFAASTSAKRPECSLHKVVLVTPQRSWRRSTIWL